MIPELNRIHVLAIVILLSCLLSRTVTAGTPVNWSDLQPGLMGAEYLQDTSTCPECHEEYINSFNHTKHGRVFGISPQNDLQKRNCEACHGPMSKHLDAPRREEFVLSLKTDGPLTHQQRNRVCLQCHEGGDRVHWQGSPHDMNGVGCSNCHYVSERRSMNMLLINEDPKKSCFQCHKERRAQLQRSSHMPLREGKMDCASCHNPHGSTGPGLLKTASVNETCYTCHTEKRGPLVWEHAPVRERCTNCHEPHGSNFPSLLKLKVPYLCQTCHSVAFHPSNIYSGSNLPGAKPAQQLLGKGCLNCHSQVHGSNHPSGARLQR